MRWVAGIASACVVTGCSLLVSTNGLVGSPKSDAGTDDALAAGDATEDAMFEGDASFDAAPLVPITAGMTTTGNALSTTSVEVPMPSGAAAGDLLLASVWFGNYNATAQGVCTPQSPWTLDVRADSTVLGSMVVFHRFVDGSEPAKFTWTLSSGDSAVAWITVYHGVDATKPIDAQGGNGDSASTTSYATPSITTTRPGTLLVASFGCYSDSNATWTLPAGLTSRADVTNKNGRTGVGGDVTMTAAGMTPAFTATVTASQFGAATLVALAPR